jgi:putative NADH-flavin reductase
MGPAHVLARSLSRDDFRFELQTREVSATLSPSNKNAAQIRTLKMLTATQQHAVDQFAKSLSALGDDALIDTYHQAWEDHREASAEGSDNLSKAYAKSLATRKGDAGSLP